MSKALFTLVLLLGTFTGPDATSAPRRKPVDKVASLSINREDFFAISSGVNEQFFRQPLEGTMPGVYEPWMGESSYNQLTYRVEIRDFDVKPNYGGIEAKGKVADVRIRIHRVFIDRNKRRYCDNLLLVSQGAGIPAELKVEPYVSAARKLQVRLKHANIGITPGNLQFKSVSSCNFVWPINRIVEQIVPVIANKMQHHVRDSILNQVRGIADEVNNQLGRVFESGFSIPFLKAPAGGPLLTYLERLNLYPSEIEVSDARLRLTLGAYLLDLPSADEPMLDSDAIADQRWNPNSFVAVAPALLNHVLHEAVRGGALNVTVSGQTQPELEPFLKAGAISELVPDARTRFSPEDPLAFAIRGAQGARLAIEPTSSPTTELQARLELDRLRFGLDVKGQPYHELALSGPVPLRLRLDRARNAALISVRSFLGLRLAGSQFAPGLQPPPAPGTGVTEAMFPEFLSTFEQLLTEESGQVFRFRLPDFRFGNTSVQYLDFRQEPGWLSFSFRLRRF